MRLPDPVAGLMAFAYRVVLRTRQIGLARTAGSLAFTTLLGIVPLATVALNSPRASRCSSNGWAR
jgi:uncharacterized BrkB/YihY/UPF0761 family membrane protein